MVFEQDESSNVVSCSGCVDHAQAVGAVQSNQAMRIAHLHKTNTSRCWVCWFAHETLHSQHEVAVGHHHHHMALSRVPAVINS